MFNNITFNYVSWL